MQQHSLEFLNFDKHEKVLRLIEKGFTVVPMMQSKVPAVDVELYRTEKPSPEEVQRWFLAETLIADPLVGVLAGPCSGIVVLAVSRRIEGAQSLEKVGGLPDTPKSKTRCFEHYYFLHPGFPVKRKLGLLPGVDLFGDRDIVIAPPSVMQNGGPIEWVVGLDQPMAPLPDYLLNLITAHPREAADIRKEPSLGGLTLVKASEVTMRPIPWLWEPVLAKGKLSIIAGDPNLGKSQFALAVAAVVSTGGKWPVSYNSASPGKVVVISAEDGADDTIVPRLTAANADLDNVFILTASKGSAVGQPLDLNRDIDRLHALLTSIGDVALIIIDPLTAYLGKADANSMGDVRGIMAKLTNLAETTNTTILAITHLNKDAAKKPIYRATGSLGFVAAARTAYLVERDPKQASRRLLVPLKNNIARDRVGFGATIESVDLDGGINTSRIRFEDALVELTADEVLDENHDPGALEKAKQFIQTNLGHGPMRSNEIEETAQSAGIARKTLQRAKTALKVRSYKIEDKWFWEGSKIPLGPNAQANTVET